ncbi:MAG: DUF11 domain-containing protein, partial [Methanophagales archaeon]|nr:DUF11 domain-containing protein [Methanophagales archaeon]
ISVSACDMRPSVFMPHDVGTVTVTLKNGAAEGNVRIKSAHLLGRDVEVLSKPYYNIGSLAPGESLNLTFTVRAPFSDGIYYPKLIIETGSGETVRYSFPLRVDSSGVSVSVASIPEEVISGERALLKIAVGNARPNEVAGVKIRAEVANGSGEVVPSEIFIGSLSPDEKKIVALNFTPHAEGMHTLSLFLSFKNGVNAHTSELSVHLVSAAKKRPELVISGIECEFDAEINAYKIKGDISNAGLSAAKGVVMRIGEGEGFSAAYPYPSYFVGSLNPDDFSSFELDVRIFSNASSNTSSNASSNASSKASPTTAENTEKCEVSIPIVIEFKDEDGYTFKKTEYVKVKLSEQEEWETSAEISPLLIAILVIIAALISSFIVYSWKKR